MKRKYFSIESYSESVFCTGTHSPKRQRCSDSSSYQTKPQYKLCTWISFIGPAVTTNNSPLLSVSSFFCEASLCFVWLPVNLFLKFGFLEGGSAVSITAYMPLASSSSIPQPQHQQSAIDGLQMMSQNFLSAMPEGQGNYHKCQQHNTLYTEIILLNFRCKNGQYLWCLWSPWPENV